MEESRKTRTKRMLTCLGLAFGLPMTLLLVALFWVRETYGTFSDLPSDAELIRSFEKNRVAYDTLVKMINEEESPRVRKITVGPEPPIQDPPGKRSITIENLIEDGALTQERLDIYRSLLRQTLTIESFGRGEDDTIWFEAGYIGGVLSSMEKGLIYKPPISEPLFDSFDKFPRTLGDYEIGYR